MNVLLTGGSSGIGAATAVLLAKRGDTVGIVGRRHDRLSAVLDQCTATSPGCRMWVADLADLDVAESLAVEAWDALGGVDVLINNAAIPKVRSVTALTSAVVEDTMQVNFFSPVRMTLALLPRMLSRGSGVIVNVASMGGRLGISREAAYSASKFALCGWSESIAIDLYGTGVSVRLVQPGPVDTDIWDRPGEEKADFHDLPKVPASEVAEGLIAAIDSETFEHYLPDLEAVVRDKTRDVDAYIKTMGELR